MNGIFISYRREDSQSITDRIYEHLSGNLPYRIFKDVDDLKPGADFRDGIDQAIQECDIALVIIGRNWLSVADGQGGRRLDNPGDFVRREVESVLQHCKQVVPVIVENATPPSAEKLPDSIAAIAFRHCVSVRNDPDFKSDLRHLQRLLQGWATRSKYPINLIRSRRKTPGPYSVGPGDALSISIHRIMDHRSCIVHDDGTITLPFQVSLPVAGKTLAQIEDSICKTYVRRQIINPNYDPHSVTAEMKQTRCVSVVVFREDSGAKRDAPGAIELPLNESDALHALLKTGGLPGPDAADELVIMRDDGLLAASPETGASAALNVRRSISIPLHFRPGESPGFEPGDAVLHTGDIVFLASRDARINRGDKCCVDLRMLQRSDRAYTLGPGDVLDIGVPRGSISRRDPNDDSEFDRIKATVREDGTLALPYVPPVLVQEMTCQEAEQAVIDAYVTNEILLADRADILIFLAEPHTVAITVIRDDGTSGPGSYSLIHLAPHSADVLHALAMTGGLPNPDVSESVVIYRHDVDYTSNDAPPRVTITILHGPDESPTIPQADVVLCDGDIVVIEGCD